MISEVPFQPYLLYFKNGRWASHDHTMPAHTSMPRAGAADRAVHLTFPTTLLHRWQGPLTHLTTVVRSGGPAGNGTMNDDVHAGTATLTIPGN